MIRRYRQVIGLHIIVDEDNLTAAALDKTIDKFLKKGEIYWQSLKPWNKENHSFQHIINPQVPLQ